MDNVTYGDISAYLKETTGSGAISGWAVEAMMSGNPGEVEQELVEKVRKWKEGKACSEPQS